MNTTGLRLSLILAGVVLAIVAPTIVRAASGQERCSTSGRGRKPVPVVAGARSCRVRIRDHHGAPCAVAARRLAQDDHRARG
jgi:hypothetical protein